MPRYSAPKLADDGVVGLVDHRVPAARVCRATRVRGGLGLDHGRGHVQNDRPVERTTIAPVAGRWASRSAVAARDRDLIAEEPGPLGAGMGDQRLVRRQFQLEVITQERRQPLLDLLGFGLRSGEPEQGVVGVTAVAQPPIARIIGILAGQAVQPPVERPRLRAVTVPAGSCDRLFHRAVLRVTGPEPASGVFRDQDRLDEDVQLVQVDVGQDRGCDAALRRHR